MVEEFKKDASSGRLYIVWEAGEEQKEHEIGIKMLMNNQIEGIIPVSCQHVDEELRLYYETAGMQTLEQWYHSKKISVKAANHILQSIIRIIHSAEPYFMEKENLVLTEGNVFLSKEGGQLWICYVPTEQRDVYDGLKRLTEFLLQHLEHSNRSETAYFYALYEMITEHSVTLDELAEHLQRQETVQSKKAKQTPDECCRDAASLAEDEGNNSQHTADYVLVSRKMRGVLSLTLPREIALQGERVRIGRHKQQDICLPPAQISREHAVMYCEGDDIQIADEDSLNGTYINGRKISAHVKVRCHIGDIITFADISYRLEKRGGASISIVS